jgi:hypothetical protein
MSTPDPASATLAPELRIDTEQWFARRGVPQLIAGWRSESAMDRRAAPLISLWLIAGTVLHWGTRPDWPPLANLAGVAATIGWMAVLWIVVSSLRHRSFRVRPSRFDLVDILTIAFLPVG